MPKLRAGGTLTNSVPKTGANRTRRAERERNVKTLPNPSYGEAKIASPGRDAVTFGRPAELKIAFHSNKRLRFEAGDDKFACFCGWYNTKFDK